MAAGQQKKRLTSSSPLKQCREKKKIKLDSSDSTQKRLVSRREQVGMIWRDMAPFVASVPHPPLGLADVLSVPQEIFSLENLTEVLSYEVWATCLSKSERKLLTRFLPSGTCGEQAVHSLLKGENLHFGNPYLKWSASLCSGNLHPNAVLRMENQCRANRKAYYSDINKYHIGMIEVLKKWKERWITCTDPEKFLSEGFTKNKHERLPLSVKRAKAAPTSKKEMPHKISIPRADVTKHMSYIKISKKQYELVKNMNHSGDGIQFQSLSRVLGDVSAFGVQRCEKIEEQENKRLHDHWLKLATKDIPVSFEKRRAKKLKEEQWVRSLAAELAGKRKLIMDKDEEPGILESSTQEHGDDRTSEHTMKDLLCQRSVNFTPNCTHGRHWDRIPFLNGHQENSSSMTSDKATVCHAILKPEANSPHLPQCFARPDPAAIFNDLVAPLSSAKATWQDATFWDSHYCPNSESHQYSPSGDLSLGLPQLIGEQPAHVIDLEHLEQHTSDTGASLFSPYEHLNSMNQPKLQFVMTSDRLLGSGQFSLQIPGRKWLPDERHFGTDFGEKELINQIDSKDVYSNGGYLNSQNFYSVEQQGPVNGGLVGHTWFPDANPTYSNGTHGFNNGGFANGRLLGVLSSYGNLRYSAQYGIGISQPFMQAGNYNEARIPNGAPDQLKSPSLDSAANTFLNNAPFMNFMQQNPSPRDPTGINSLRPWNL